MRLGTPAGALLTWRRSHWRDHVGETAGTSGDENARAPDWLCFRDARRRRQWSVSGGRQPDDLRVVEPLMSGALPTFPQRRVLRIGCGAGYSGDRVEPAVELVERGDLDFLIFECLAERTIAIAQQAKARDPNAGFDVRLRERMEAVLPASRARGTKVITNMGAANPLAAAACVRDAA